eukprot:1868084-Karenia_brevis.AAC.1
MCVCKRAFLANLKCCQCDYIDVRRCACDGRRFCESSLCVFLKPSTCCDALRTHHWQELENSLRIQPGRGVSHMEGL